MMYMMLVAYEANLYPAALQQNGFAGGSCGELVWIACSRVERFL